MSNESGETLSSEVNEETVVADENKPKVFTEADFHNKLNAALNNRFKTFEEKLLKVIPTKEEKKEPEKVSATELVEMKNELKAMRDKEKATLQKSRDAHLKNAVKDQLTSVGVPPQFLKAALATILSDNLVSIAEDADQDDLEPEIVFKSSEGNVSLSNGIKNIWLKTEDSQAFLSASNPKGSGDKGYKAPKTNSKEIKPGDIGKMLLNFRG